MEIEDKMKELENVVTTVKRGRGRPPKDGVKKQNSSFALQAAAYDPDEDTRTIISDKVLEPYKIIATKHSYNVVDSVRPEGAIADNPYAYCTSLENALLKIARLKTTKNKTYLLKEYIDEYRQIIQELKDTVKLTE